MTTPLAPRPRFGVWTLVEGRTGASHHPDDPVDASYERCRNQVLEAEQLGFDTTLLAQHTINPHGEHYDELEAWTASAAFAALTERIEIITAIKPYLYHPVVLAKMALQIEEISGGRFAINFVNGWFRPEAEKAGLGFRDHDARYAYGREWLTVFRSLIRGERTSISGEHFTVEEYLLAPRDRFRERPVIYAGGASEPARTLVAHAADVLFMNSRPPADITAIVDDMRARPRSGPALRFGLSAFVIARESDEEAESELAYLRELAELDRSEFEQLARNADWQRSPPPGPPNLGTNGGVLSNLVGSYDTVAERINHFYEIGVETFMVQFQPFEAEMRRFAEYVIPRVRRRTAAAA